MDLKSKIVLVTGSSHNIGQAIALKFAQAGADIVVHARTNVSLGEKVRDQILTGGRKAIFVQADLSQPEQVKELFQKIKAEFGGLDILINNAGSVIERKFIDSDKPYWTKAFDDNFFGAVLCSIEAAKMMSDKVGKIINNASMRGLDHAGREGIMAYSAAKAALISFTKTLAKDLAPNILVNAVAPGYTRTTAFDDVPEAVVKAFIEESLVKRWLTPEEIADAFLYLAQADGVTGTVLVIDGGWNLR
jgi:3-oxoacyl-[acyl-carrier protein] reductase